MSRALVIVDVQRDFLPGGALAVPDGDAVIAPIAALAHDGGFDVVLATRDWHPPDHSSFRDQGGPWPAHCVRDTPGAELDPGLGLEAIDAIIDKGVSAEGPGYSGFESETLRTFLRDREIDAITIVGLATDVCVAATAHDALAEGIAVTIDRAGVRGIEPEESERVLRELATAGASIVG